MGSVIVYLLRCSNFRSHIEIIRHFICKLFDMQIFACT